MTYPNSTGHVATSETSRASAQMLDESGAADTQAAEIIGYLERLSLRGGTADELTVWMQRSGFPHIHNGTVAGRLVHLEKQGRIIKTAVTRKTRSNRMANVYMLACHSDKVELAPKAGIEVLKPVLKELYDTLEAGNKVSVHPGGKLHQALATYYGD